MALSELIKPSYEIGGKPLSRKFYHYRPELW